jgi:hypothetical protein
VGDLREGEIARAPSFHFRGLSKETVMRDLRLVHTEEYPGNIAKIIAAIAVALAIGVVGVYTYDIGLWKTAIVSDNALPSPGPVLNVPARTPPPSR